MTHPRGYADQSNYCAWEDLDGDEAGKMEEGRLDE